MAKYLEILEAINKLSEGFGRIDERTRNIWRLTEKLEKHNATQNGLILEQCKIAASNKTSISRLWWLLGIIVIGSGSAIGLVQWLG